MRYYILRKNNYYLSSIYYMEDFDGNMNLSSYEVDKEYRKLYDDFEKASEDRRTIFIETGLYFEIEVFKDEN